MKLFAHGCRSSGFTHDGERMKSKPEQASERECTRGLKICTS
jgi:hypothetical protein